MRKKFDMGFWQACAAASKDSQGCLTDCGRLAWICEWSTNRKNDKNTRTMAGTQLRAAHAAL